MDNRKDESDYTKVERWCRDQIWHGSDFIFDPILFEAAIKAASKDFDFPLESLQSLFRNFYVKHIKVTSHTVKESLQTKLIKEYSSGRSIKELAKESNFSPALLARRLVEEMTALGNTKLSTVMKNPLEELKSIDVIKTEYQQAENSQHDGR